MKSVETGTYFGHPSYSHKNSEQLFREWNEVDFPKLTLGFGFGKSVPRNERNNCQLLLKGALFRDHSN